MINESQLIRSAGKVSTYVQKYVNLVGAEKREEVLQLFDTMHRLFPHWVISTCPVMHPEIKYISKNSQYIFGYGPEKLTQMNMVINFFSRVHDSDQEHVHECFQFLQETMETIPPDEHQHYRVIFHYRYRKEDGTVMYLMDEKACLKIPNNGNLYYSLFRDVTEEQAFAGVRADVYKQENRLIKIQEFKPSAGKLELSKRERDLLPLIKQGLSNKEIAWYLKISQYTVRNIKSKMFEKFKVNNSIELLNMAS